MGDKSWEARGGGKQEEDVGDERRKWGMRGGNGRREEEVGDKRMRWETRGSRKREEVGEEMEEER